MIPPSYTVTSCNRNTPYGPPDDMVWGEWRGTNVAEVVRMIESDRRVRVGWVQLMNTLGKAPSDRCNRGVFFARYDGNHERYELRFATDGPDIPW